MDINWKLYSPRETLFDSPSEFEFYTMLRDEILGTKLVALIQVPIARIIEVRGKKFDGTFDGHRSRIDKKSVDFLICDQKDLRPRVAIELDGSSHKLKERIARDRFVDQLFLEVNFPLIRVERRRTYDAFAIAGQIGKPLGLTPRRP